MFQGRAVKLQGGYPKIFWCQGFRSLRNWMNFMVGKFGKSEKRQFCCSIWRMGSMGLVYWYICLHLVELNNSCVVNVGTYTIHGSYGCIYMYTSSFLMHGAPRHLLASTSQRMFNETDAGIGGGSDGRSCFKPSKIRKRWEMGSMHGQLNSDQNPGCLLCIYIYIYGIILPSYIGIAINHYKDPY